MGEHGLKSATNASNCPVGESDGDSILTVNVGSSSVKLSLLDNADQVLSRREIEVAGASDSVHAATLETELEQLWPFCATSHRIVHGGARFTRPVLADSEVIAELGALANLAPLHQQRALSALSCVMSSLPQVPAVACFDTSFHATIPRAASTYAIPARWREDLGIRRYGFHGLSYAYATRRSAELLGRSPTSLRLVIAHLGSGASLAAVKHGSSVDTTMGFTPLEGLVMATRPGNVDPGALLWLLQNGVRTSELDDTLEHASGLVGLTGTQDMRSVLLAAHSGQPDAQLGLEVYLHRLRSLVASMVAATGGIDALVFTGGVGENSPYIREHLARGIGFLGVNVDTGANASATSGGDALISPRGARVAVLVVESREDVELAQEARRLLQTGRPQASAI
ncbi:MAG: acetate/propionate family kinase [Actinomycetota bacterium]|nr:acetate/propionate family kinase [Actinomycetota bacterium]